MKIRICFLVFAILLIPASLFSEKCEMNCFTVIAGKNASATGSVIIAHNEDDRGSNLIVNIHKLKSAKNRKGIIRLKNGGTLRNSPFSLGALWMQMPSEEFADSYVNEHGVTVCSNKTVSREGSVRLSSGGIGFMLRRIVALRARTAREGVMIAGKLIERFGYNSSGRTLCIADHNEGWILHIVRGRHWIAQRVPDDQVAVIANSYTINRINLKDRNNYLGSEDIIEYAIKKKWFDPDKEGIFDFALFLKKSKDFKYLEKAIQNWTFQNIEGKFSLSDKNSKKDRVFGPAREWRAYNLKNKFDFARIYSDPVNFQAMRNILRQWRGTSLLSEKKHSIVTRLPFSFKPARKITVEKLFEILRDHYEGTEFDLSDNYRKGSPNLTKIRTICTSSTKYSFVISLNKPSSDFFGPTVWLCLGRPDSNAFSPWPVRINSVPTGYSSLKPEKALARHFTSDADKSSSPLAYKTYRRLSELTDANYKERIYTVKKEWKNIESYFMRKIKKFEKEFKSLSERNPFIAKCLLTSQLKAREYKKWFLANELIKKIKKD